jgi:prolipoprotein diacylglyceryltransferase
MSVGLFVFIMASALLIVLLWSFSNLPGERWQVMAALPKSKLRNDSWEGLNLTYYGLFIANACAFAVIVAVLLLGSVSMPWEGIFILISIALAVCIPASRIIAALVEKKKHTITVGGASFTGILITPWIVWAINWTGWYYLNPMVVFSAFCVAYVLGEALGRLACISFGCCYGKLLSEAHPALLPLFSKWHFVFSGPMKKIAYESGLDGHPVVPIQAMTSLLYAATGLAGVYLFLNEHYIAAFLLSLVISQLWRALSEMLRADHRGGGKISAYQLMALFSIPYSMLTVYLLPLGPEPRSSLDAGLSLLWNPGAILLLQLFWVAVFLWCGRSSVTGSILSFHVKRDRI